MNTLLNVGDIVYETNDGKFRARRRVERVTATQAVLECGTKLRREISGDYLHEIGRGRWSSLAYRLCTEKNTAAFEAQKAEMRLKIQAEKVADSIRNYYRVIGADRLARIQAILNETP